MALPANDKASRLQRPLVLRTALVVGWKLEGIAELCERKIQLRGGDPCAAPWRRLRQAHRTT